MDVLLVEDDMLKADELCKLLESMRLQIKEIAKSYRSALEAIMCRSFDFCVLDLALPTFDRTDEDDDSYLEQLGGKLLLEEMKRKSRKIPTIVVTQYRFFGELMSEETLEDVDEVLKSEFSDFYLGAVFYSEEETDWKVKIEDAVKLTQRKVRI